MADVHDVREAPASPPPLAPRRRGSLRTALTMFLLGALLILIVVLALLRPTWTISWPAGRVDIGLWPEKSASEVTAPSYVTGAERP